MIPQFYIWPGHGLAWVSHECKHAQSCEKTRSKLRLFDVMNEELVGLLAVKYLGEQTIRIWLRRRVLDEPINLDDGDECDDEDERFLG
jgi:hypothetical protein